ncbi:hypothetical protein C8R44DRAFT_973590, partial [Mycena epipterygia]
MQGYYKPLVQAYSEYKVSLHHVDSPPFGRSFTMKRFPSDLELEDAIIDFCHADHATLASCSLVCHDWLAASRYHIFSSMLTTQKAPRFLAITSSSTRIVPLVQEIELHFSAASLPHLLPILMRLNRTTRLSLHSTCLQHFATGTSKIRLRSRFESLSQVIDYISLCPQLKSLELGGSWSRMGDLAVPPLLPKALHTLILTCDLDNFLTWLLTLKDDMPAIHNLILHHIVRREMPVTVKYLQASGPTLCSLVLFFPEQRCTQPLRCAGRPL